MNSYFASVEQQLHPELRGLPIAVSGKRTERSVVAAASIEAKRLGVRTAMSTQEALRVCPHLRIVQPTSGAYVQFHKRFNAIFRRYTHLVEPFSVDESFLDVTGTAGDYFTAITFAQMIKDDLRRECGAYVTASVGIGPNKSIAKAASDRMKPDGLVVIRPEEAESFLLSLSLQDVCGIGRKTAQRLEQMGITTMEDLRATPAHVLEEHFHHHGVWMSQLVHARDDRPVSAQQAAPKSFGHSYTLPRDAYDERTARQYMLGLCDRVAWRLRQHHVRASFLHVQARYSTFAHDGKQIRLSEASADGLTLFRAAWPLFRQLPGVERLFSADPTIRGIPGIPGIRLLGVSTSGLQQEGGSASFFPLTQKHEEATKALDHLQQRYGTHAWMRASTLAVQLKERAHGFAHRSSF